MCGSAPAGITDATSRPQSERLAISAQIVVVATMFTSGSDDDSIGAASFSAIESLPLEQPANARVLAPASASPFRT